MAAIRRSFIATIHADRDVSIRGWVLRLRTLAKTTFIIVKDCSGTVQCVGATPDLHEHHLHLDDAIEIHGRVRADKRAAGGFEIDIHELRVLNRSSRTLPFHSSTDISGVGSDILLEYRPLALRNERGADIFKIQAAIVHHYREFLAANHFTEIISSKIVSGGTEGGTNLFAIRYFDRVAYLAQSPQFYKEHGVAGFERVFETGHVYRAEPHATSRHLTEYYSLDFEMGFIDGPEDIIQMERELLSHIFDQINRHHLERIMRFGRSKLPSMMEVPIWTFDECLERLHRKFGRSDLVDDLDPEAERQLCRLVEKETGVPAVFVLGFPLASRPFYTHPRTETTAAGFDLLFGGIEITTGGQRLHRRQDLERSLTARGISPQSFESHLRMFDIGMPPHGGLAIGLERLTAQILGLANIRDATLYPRDRYRVTP
jgi:nondiscriminating aspartyl-tRNA synthetase